VDLLELEDKEIRVVELSLFLDVVVVQVVVVQVGVEWVEELPATV
jgi:hypothetical protein